VADFRLNVTADTQRAEKDLQRLGKTANDATKSRSLRIDVSELNRNFKDVQRNVKDAGNTIQSFYRVSKNIPGVGDRVREFENLAKGAANVARSAPSSAAALRENAKAGSILANSFEAASSGAGRLVNNLAKAGFALFAIKEAVGVVKSAFGGFFNETIGREIKLRETILKTQTTLASTNKVFRNGTEITDPYEKIVALTGEVQKRIDSIRERSIALAGVTSNEVIEVFGIVASQIGQIGGGLKEAEDLAINFSAALGTFGIPLYQARQEIGSILRGDITTDSYLAKALGITNEEVARAKTQAGGVVKFLEERLAASVAGQRIAAQGFSGVVSNIRDLGELISQRFGAGLLDPLLGGLTRVFDFLFKIREEVFAISEGIGRGLGSLLSTNLSIISGGSGLFAQIGAGAESFGAQLAEGVQKGFASLQASANTVIAPLRNLFEEIAKSIGLVGAGLARLAQGFLSIQIENFKALVQILSNLSEAVTAFSAGLGQVLRAYGQLLQVPFVQYLSQISTQFQLLERLGVMSAVKLAFAAAGLIAAWQPIVTFFQGLATRIAAIVAGLVAAVGAAFVRMGAIVAAFAGTLTSTVPAVEALKQQLLGLSTSLTTAGGSAEKASASIARFGGATTAAARTAGSAILGFVKMNLILLAIQVAITVLIDAFGKFQQKQEDTARSERAAQALKNLQTKYKDVGDSADSATKSARDFEQAIVDAEYARGIDALEKVREQINQIKYELKPGIQSWREFWSAVSGSEVGRFEQGLREDLQGLQAQEQRLKGQLSSVDRQRDKDRAAENIRLEAQNRVSLEKEIGELRRQQDNELFQLRQQRAQKEVEIFRAAGDLRIFQMEEANKKLIAGEEGASRTALEALNNYLSVRERGELEIESAKKLLVVEAANLEKQISDYRLENEKKIAEIRKRAGDYEKNVADYRRQLTGQSPVGGATGLTQGNTGTSSSGPHFHVAGAASEAEARAIFAPDINRQLQLTDRPGSARSGGRTHQGYDLAGPTGTPLNLAPGYTLQNFTRDPKGLGGNYATIAGPKGQSYKIMHLADPGSGYKGPGSTSVAPTAPTFADIGAPATEKYASAVRSLTSAMERLRVLQAALTEAKTAAAFNEIAKAMFPKVGIEQYQDKLDETRFALTELGKASATSFDPDRVALTAEYNGELNSRARELAQLLETAAKQLKPDEFYKLWVQLKASNEKFKQDLAAQNKLKEDQLRLDKARNTLQETLNRTRSRQESTADSLLRTRLRLEGMSPELVDAEVQKEQARRGLSESLQNPETRAGAQAALDAESAAIDAEALAKLAENDPLTGLLGKWKSEIKDTRSMVASLAQTFQTEVSGAMSNAVMGVINGTTTVQEAFSNLFQNVAKAFLDMAVQIIAKQITMLIFGTLLKALGVPLGGGGGGGDMFKPNFSAMEFVADGGAFGQNGIIPFAKGGVVSKPTLFRFADGASLGTGVMGEAGPEGILPLTRGPNGKLGVSAYGNSGNVNVVVNVDATGSKVEGDDQKANALGRVVSAAVQQEIIKQKRPGGLLA
jgi:lambda family phage tail tape measure protein